MRPIISLLVDNEPTAVSSFVLPSMGLSSSRSEMRKRSFSIGMSSASLVEALTPLYRDWVAESRLDDEQCGSPQDDLAEAGYPSLQELLGKPDLLRLVVGGYLSETFLSEMLFPWEQVDAAEFWLDQVTHCCCVDGAVFISGVCYSRL